MRPLKARSASIDEWVKPHSSDMTLIGDATTRGFEIIQNLKCLNCGVYGHFKRNCRENQINPKRESNFLGYVRDVAKVNIGLVNVNRQQTNGATLYQKLPGGLLTGPNAKQVMFSSSGQQYYSKKCGVCSHLYQKGSRHSQGTRFSMI